MKYDAFISYTAKDEKWAEKLSAALTQIGIKVFFAPGRLDVGTNWETAGLEAALYDSRNLILLWSDNANASDWVKREASEFRGHIYSDERQGTANNRRLVQVLLSGKFDLFSAWHAIDLSKDPRHKFSEGADKADKGLFDELVAKLAAAMTLDLQARPLLQLILAATREEMAAIDFSQVPVHAAQSMNDLLLGLAITRDELLERYGDNRGDWRPFHGETNILAMLGEFRSLILERGGSAFLWQPIGERFWTERTDSDYFLKLVSLLETKPCVIVIDALSLYSSTVWQRYNELTDCIRNTNAAIMVLPPIGFAPRAVLHESLRRMIQGYYKLYFNLRYGLVETRLAHCNLLTPDDIEISRLLVKAVNQASSHWATSTSASS